MKALMLCPLPPYFGGSAYSCMELCIGLNQGSFSCLAVTPIHSTKYLPQYPFPHNWIESFFHTDGNRTPKELVHKINQEIKNKVSSLREFDIIILGRESFIWYLPYIKAKTSAPVVLIVRGAYINSICKSELEDSVCKDIIELYKECDLIITVADHLAQKLNKIGIGNITVIPNAANDRYLNFHQTVPKLCESQKIVFAGQLKSRKRPLHAIQSFQNSSISLNGIQLDIAGKGPDYDSLITYCKQWGLLKNINFLGVIDQEQMPDLLNSCNIVILPSVDEGLSRIILEAQAVGRCVLAYDCDGNREAIRHMSTGFLVPTGDVNALSKGLSYLFTKDGKQLCEEISRKSFLKAKSWTSQDQIKKYQSVLSEIA